MYISCVVLVHIFMSVSWAGGLYYLINFTYYLKKKKKKKKKKIFRPSVTTLMRIVVKRIEVLPICLCYSMYNGRHVGNFLTWSDVN